MGQPGPPRVWAGLG